MDFKGKTAVVTGAAVGIGRAVSVMMAKNGANIVAVDINADKLEQLRIEIADIGARCITAVCDVSDAEAVSDSVQKAVDEFGGVDILVNNAAVWKGFFDSFLKISDAEWQKYLNINVMGTVYFTKAVLPYMLRKGWGRIINIASVAGVYGIANMVHYSATKGAVIAMTKALAKEVAGKGITVNSVAPGTVSPAENDDMDYTQPNELSYMGRTGSDNENAELICFLAGDGAAYISGQNIQIDGCRRRI